MNKWLKVIVVLVVVSLLVVTVGAVSAQQGRGNRGGQNEGLWMGRGGHFGFGGQMLTTVAEQLGLDSSALVTELQAGKTVADLAAEKGVEVSAIVDAVIANHQELAASAVESGRFTQEQVDAMTETLRTNLTAHFNGETAFDGDFGFGMGRGANLGLGRGLMWVTVAEQLGLDAAALTTELQSGKTVADLAAEKGIEVSAIVDAVIAQHQEQVAAAVAAGTITQAQADTMLENSRTHLTARFNGETAFGGMGMMGGRGGMGRGMMGGRGGMGRGGMGNGFGNPFAPAATPEADT